MLTRQNQFLKQNPEFPSVYRFVIVRFMFCLFDSGFYTDLFDFFEHEQRP